MGSQFVLGYHLAHPVGVVFERAWQRSLHALSVRQDHAQAQTREIFPDSSQRRCQVGVGGDEYQLLDSFISRKPILLRGEPIQGFLFLENEKTGTRPVFSPQQPTNLIIAYEAE